MSRKRGQERGPKKLSSFTFKQSSELTKIQDGAAGAVRKNNKTHTNLSDSHPPEMDEELSSSYSNGSSQLSPTSQGPAKSRMKLDLSCQAADTVNTALHSDNAMSSLQTSIAAFPTSGQPVLDTTMKEMLVSLQSSIISNLSSMIHKFSLDMKHMDGRLQYVENKMEECTETVNELVDACTEQKDDSMWVKMKLADLEDHSRRNNIKMRGIPESVLPMDLRNYANTLFSTLLPELSPIELTIDRIHRIPKPKHLEESIPRDVILRIHFYQAKEQILSKARELTTLPPPYSDIQLFADLSQFTLQMRRQLKTVTKALSNHKITYKWRHPATILTTYNGKHFAISTIEDGMQLLQTWGIIVDLPHNTPALKEKPNLFHFGQKREQNRIKYK